MTTPTRAAPSDSQKAARAAQTHCYNHPDRVAVGVCVVCKRGVCRLCRVTLKGKNFCRADEEILRRKVQPTARMKYSKNAITLAAALAIVNGLAGAVVGFLLLIIGLVGPQAQGSYTFTSTLQPFFNYFGDVLKFPASQALDVGLIAFLIGIINIIAATMLFRRSRTGGIVAIACSVFGGFLINTYLVILALAGDFTYIHLVLSAAKVALIVYGWKYLEER